MVVPLALPFWMMMTMIVWIACPRCVTTAEFCGNCSSLPPIPEEKITEIRIENIKQQILKKLRLIEPPQVEPNISLPEPLRLPITEAISDDDDSYDDDFYGKLEQIVLFPTNGGSGCDSTANKSAICFFFQLPAELEGFSLESAEFWLYKERIAEDDGWIEASNLTSHEDELVVSEVANLDSSRNESGLFTQRIRSTGGWVKADITTVAQKWQQFQGPESSHNIYVSCPTCAMGVRPPVSLKSNEKPFLTISVDYHSKSRRQKRNNVACAPGVEECCKENLNISFAAFGWDKWIISPVTYNAYYCKGTCASPSSVTIGNYYHSVIKQYSKQNPNEKVVSCCTAQKFSELDVIYLEGGIIHKRKLPNMVVESCGCV